MGFESFHPAINFLFFLSVISSAVGFDQPVFLAISCLCAFSYSVKRNGWNAVIFNLCLIPLAAAFTMYYIEYHHFGITVLSRNFIGNNMTLESLLQGIVLSAQLAAAVMWCSCLFSVFTADKIVYLLGRVSPKISLFLSILLRLVPRIKIQAKKLHSARQSVGRGIHQGTLLQRFVNGVKIFSMLITWVLDSISTLSDSMRSRGYSLKGRTAFSIYRFDNRDRSLVIAMFTCLTGLIMAVLLGQTDMVFDPNIQMAPISSMSFPFYFVYTVLCLLPLWLELYSRWSFARGRASL